MQDETQAPGAEAATQESNETPDPGAAANPGGSEGLRQEQPSGEGPAATPSEQGGSPFLGVDETGPPTGDVDEIEMPPDYVGTPPPGPVEQAGGGEVADAPATEPWGGAPLPGPVEQEAPLLVEEPEADEPSATERVEPPGSETAPIVEGEASSPLIGGGGALPTEDFLRAEAFSGKEGEGAPDAAAAGEGTVADAAVGGAAVGAVGEAGGPGETIEDAASEAILDPPEATEDAFISKEMWDHMREHIPPGTTGGAPSEPAPSKIGDAVGGDMTHPDVKAAEAAADAAADAVMDKGEAVEEYVEITGEALEDLAESIPIVGDDLGDAVGDATDAAQDVVKDVVKNVSEDVRDKTFLEDLAARGAAAEEAAEALGEAVEETIEITGEALEDFVEGIPIVGDDLGDAVRDATDAVQDVVDNADDPVVEDVDPWG